MLGATSSHWFADTSLYLPCAPALALCKSMLAALLLHFAALSSSSLSPASPLSSSSSAAEGSTHAGSNGSDASSAAIVSRARAAALSACVDVRLVNSRALRRRLVALVFPAPAEPASPAAVRFAAPALPLRRYGPTACLPLGQ